MHFRARVDHEDLVQRKTYIKAHANVLITLPTAMYGSDRQTDRQTDRDIET